MTLDDNVLRHLRLWLERQTNHRPSNGLDCHDLVDEAMLRFLVASNTREIESPFAYAHRILMRLIADRIKKLERDRKALEILAWQREVESRTWGNGNSRENGDLIRYLMGRAPLTSVQRTVITMIYLEEKTIGEVARELSRNPGTIAQHRRRGLDKLIDEARGLGEGP